MRRWLLALAAVLALGVSEANAATLYISEFNGAVTQVGSSPAQIQPVPAITDQTVALSGSSATSSAFSASTHSLILMCDEGCSVKFGGSTVSAATTNFLLQQGVPYRFGVAPNTYVAAIANAAGNIPGGGGGTDPVNLTQVGGAAIALGQTTKSGSIPVTIASDQGTQPVSIASAQVASGAYASGALADGADTTEGVTTDAAATQGSTGTVSAKLRTVTSQLNTLNTQSWTDPCASPGVAKSSVAISITSATTTSLVAVSGSTAVYVCGFVFTDSQVITTANTLQFEYGTGAACSSPTALTGLLGGGGITAAAPITISAQADRTLFKTPASNGVCALTAIGATGSFQGVLTYVQQ